MGGYEDVLGNIVLALLGIILHMLRDDLVSLHADQTALCEQVTKNREDVAAIRSAINIYGIST